MNRRGFFATILAAFAAPKTKAVIKELNDGIRQDWDGSIPIYWHSMEGPVCGGSYAKGNSFAISAPQFVPRLPIYHQTVADGCMVPWNPNSSPETQYRLYTPEDPCLTMKAASTDLSAEEA